MSREVDTSKNLSRDDIVYLQSRGQLPADVEPVDNDLSRGPRNLDDVPNTGDANSAGLTKEEWDLIMERRQKAQLEDQPSFDTAGGIVEAETEEGEEDYLQGWTNDTRRAELSRRDLSVEGSKDELIARLRRSDYDELEPEDAGS